MFFRYSVFVTYAYPCKCLCVCVRQNLVVIIHLFVVQMMHGHVFCVYMCKVTSSEDTFLLFMGKCETHGQSHIRGK